MGMEIVVSEREVEAVETLIGLNYVLYGILFGGPSLWASLQLDTDKVEKLMKECVTMTSTMRLGR